MAPSPRPVRASARRHQATTVFSSISRHRVHAAGHGAERRWRIGSTPRAAHRRRGRPCGGCPHPPPPLRRVRGRHRLRVWPAGHHRHVGLAGEGSQIGGGRATLTVASAAQQQGRGWPTRMLRPLPRPACQPARCRRRPVGPSPRRCSRAGRILLEQPGSGFMCAARRHPSPGRGQQQGAPCRAPAGKATGSRTLSQARSLRR